MDRTQIGILKKSDEVSLRRFLKGEDSVALESEISLEILSNLPHQPLEWKLPYQQLGTLLVLSDLPKGDGSWAVAMGLLHSAGGRGRFPCCLNRSNNEGLRLLGLGLKFRVLRGRRK